MSTILHRVKVGTIGVVTAALVLSASPALAAEEPPVPVGTGTETPAPSTPASITTTPPSVQGTAAVGSVLTASVEGWDPAPNLTYQWLRAGAPITGATAATYRLQAADFGMAISVQVTGTLDGYQSVTLTSAPTTAVAAGPLKPAGSIKGTVRVGYTLTAVPGNWGTTGVKFTYRWYANGKAISGATKSTLKITAPLYAKRLSVRITGSRTAYVTASNTVTARSNVAAGKLKVGKVWVTGTMVQGQLIRARVSGWGPKGVKYSYQWYVGNKRIRGAQKSTLRIASRSLDGKRVRVKVTAKLRGYATASKYSYSTLPINRIRLDRRCLTAGRVLCADKTARKLYRVHNGRIIDGYDARFGMPGLRTRNGVHRIWFRNANQWSSIYHVRMPYSLFFYGGQAVHFSDDFYRRGYSTASHGCINLREWSAAKRIYYWAHTGDKVVVYGRDH